MAGHDDAYWYVLSKGEPDRVGHLDAKVARCWWHPHISPKSMQKLAKILPRSSQDRSKSSQNPPKPVQNGSQIEP